ncbi:MAG: molybdopterin molybdotransferase [Oceanospirillaceae bacterium]|uniref:molybdopterin molybdotransferase MoeA n=1 Tax=unclassified Thalassolituus TaxID=2624967 RepID=UPI000C0924CD|nr:MULTISPECIES: molybdopterin molybdotransferase MoeA [unclassified Thalassolituus]MAK90891.1 molybdopterin molybdotransferase [Thalassolituus sp.]MAS25864.1 molybdopterin molybdotransferase [Oceanospirillaceae bacterium]MAX98928.1 molybdopterin molybdotransferase [Oceanospirillaceae bacterium]MBL34098.1 molybdopterin molybdotransferase [Oceanospirillaceae bacterium]MBS54077.1 molybdopterin molybdotransferase [Oceanospirillaceae bacterium]|tara:strand:+ start:2882 stop:4117 length:1236 start_codon:yes stop_codon:yes gene_type:complete
MITCDSPGLAPVDQALESLLNFVQPKPGSATIALADADGRVLAEDIHSSLNVPPADNSAMDGYAVRAADLAAGDTLKLAGKSMAGHPFIGQMKAGECIRIMTGAVMPDGADTVVMQENTEVAGEGLIRFPHPAEQGDNVRLCGEDIRSGQQILASGRRLRPADLGLLASIGIAQVSVKPRIKVALMATGDELVAPGQPLATGQIYQSNSFTVGTMLRRLGCEVVDFGIVEDSASALRAAFEQADSAADVVMTTGGVSVGEADYTKDVLESLGRIDFWRLAIKPGKPFACGHLPNSLFIGLPGNPVSAMVTMHQLATPMLRRLAGEQQVMAQRLTARAAEVLRKRPGRTDFQRGICSYDSDGQLQVRAAGNQSSAVLSSLSQANCYIVLEQQRGRVESGETVTVELFDGLLL